MLGRQHERDGTAVQIHSEALHFWPAHASTSRQAHVRGYPTAQPLVTGGRLTSQISPALTVARTHTGLVEMAHRTGGLAARTREPSDASAVLTPPPRSLDLHRHRPSDLLDCGLCHQTGSGLISGSDPKHQNECGTIWCSWSALLRAHARQYRYIMLMQPRSMYPLAHA